MTIYASRRLRHPMPPQRAYDFMIWKKLLTYYRVDYMSEAHKSSQNRKAMWEEVEYARKMLPDFTPAFYPETPLPMQPQFVRWHRYYEDVYTKYGITERHSKALPIFRARWGDAR